MILTASSKPLGKTHEKETSLGRRPSPRRTNNCEDQGHIERAQYSVDTANKASSMWTCAVALSIID